MRASERHAAVALLSVIRSYDTCKHSFRGAAPPPEKGGRRRERERERYYIQIYTNIYKYIQIYTNIYKYIQIYIYIYCERTSMPRPIHVGHHDKSYEQNITGLHHKLLILTFLLCKIYNPLSSAPPQTQFCTSKNYHEPRAYDAGCRHRVQAFKLFSPHRPSLSLGFAKRKKDFVRVPARDLARV